MQCEQQQAGQREDHARAHFRAAAPCAAGHRDNQTRAEEQRDHARRAAFEREFEEIVVRPVGSGHVDIFEPLGGQDGGIEAADPEACRPVTRHGEPGIAPDFETGVVLQEGKAPHGPAERGLPRQVETHDRDRDGNRGCGGRCQRQALPRREWGHERGMPDEAGRDQRQGQQRYPCPRARHHHCEDDKQGQAGNQAAQGPHPLPPPPGRTGTARQDGGGKQIERQQPDQEQIGGGIPVGLEARHPAPMGMGVETE